MSNGGLSFLKQAAEQAYTKMYDAPTQSEANACYRDAKEYLYDAITLAGKLGLQEEKRALQERLLQIKAVYRNQFS